MKKGIGYSVVMVLLTIAFTTSVWAQNGRTNVIWARTTTENIVLDGQLTENSWSKAESLVVEYGNMEHLIPGSGYRLETGIEPSDPTHAVIKFLVNGNKLYVAVDVKDSSVGGGLFNRFDGFLINIRNHADPNRPAPPFEYFYGWVTETWADTSLDSVGALPGFFGWAADDRSVWDAATVVHGISNSDTLPDEGYTTEFMFDLTARGYDVTDSDGDIIEFNISIYDADWQWPLNVDKFSGNRTWWCGPWGNANVLDVARIYARPDVTVDTQTLPEVGPEVVIQNGEKLPSPTIDGVLNEEVWANAQGFDIRYGDDALRDSYPAIGPYRSGQFQPAINDITASVLDPGDATIKMFFKNDTLYLGVDVRDQAVWGINNPDMWDGIRFVIEDRAARDEYEHTLLRRSLTAIIDTLGNIAPMEDLAAMVDTNTAVVAMSLKGNSTVNDYNDVDEGYQIEMAVDLKALGYPPDLGDHVLFFSATLFDGEKFPNPADDYGTRTWFFREAPWTAAPAWGYMDTSAVIEPTGINDDQPQLPVRFEILGNYPNPFNPTTTIRYSIPSDGKVVLKVFNVLGQQVEKIDLGLQKAGVKEIQFNGKNLSSGTYFYKLEYHIGNQVMTGTGRMTLLK